MAVFYVIVFPFRGQTQAHLPAAQSDEENEVVVAGAARRIGRTLPQF